MNEDLYVNGEEMFMNAMSTTLRATTIREIRMITIILTMTMILRQEGVHRPQH